ncbi:MAG: polynucleotide adenylyltransferase PcnB [Acidobacteriia bacterium]|nr:polynucleotide adenylyltransferase PcnB [Terriglobia bacterium]
MSEPEEKRGGPQVLARAEHTISRAAMSPNALKVLYRLHGAGFLAYLVGGAVRDLLLGRRPKDFDIGTNARPQQVRQLFRNARVIGRRFRLVMVRFASEVVEVATFRRSPEPPEIEEGETADVLAPTPDVDEYGTPEEDAWRRDFTVNALFYNIADFSVIDHVGGLADLDAGVIRTVGPPRLRFAEDPVRMMRAVEYAARLGFRLEDELADATASMHPEIRRAAPARIAYELLESLKGGSALRIFRGLEDASLLGHIVPEAHAATVSGNGAVLWSLLASADERYRKDERVGEETLLALLFLPQFLAALQKAGERLPPAGDIERLAREQLEPAMLRLAISHYRGHVVRSSLLLLTRMMAPAKSGKHVLRTVRHEAFSTAWQVMHLLAEVDGRYRSALAAWEHPVSQALAGRAPAVEATKLGREEAARGRRRGRRGGRRHNRPKPAGAP